MGSIINFKPLVTVVTGLMLSGLSINADNVTVVRGVMVSNDSWESSNPQAGIYDIEVKADGAITPVYIDPGMASVLSALKKDDVLYTCNLTSTGSYFYQKYSVDDWSAVGTKTTMTAANVPSDLAYDPVTDKAYGGFWSENYNGFSLFGSFNLSTAKATFIDKVQRDERDIFALAADGKGTIYCLFGSYDYLATLDPTDGQVYRIKTTGINIDVNLMRGKVNSMCYDEDNDRLIATVYETDGWGANLKESSALYVIDPATGATEKVMEFPDNLCFAGIYVLPGLSSGTACATVRSHEVKVAGGEIVISGLSDEKVEIYSLDGRRVMVSATAASEMRVPVPGGVYLVKVGSETTKVLVR